MRDGLIWFAVAGVVKTPLLYAMRLGALGGATDYLVVVGVMLVAMAINIVLAVGYLAMTRPLPWLRGVGLLCLLALMDYGVAELVIWWFGMAA